MAKNKLVRGPVIIPGPPVIKTGAGGKSVSSSAGSSNAIKRTGKFNNRARRQIETARNLRKLRKRKISGPGPRAM